MAAEEQQNPEVVAVSGPAIDYKAIAEALKPIIGETVKSHLGEFEKRFKSSSESVKDEPARNEAADKPADPKSVEYQLQKLTQELEAERKRREASEKAAAEKDRQTAIRAELQRFSYAKPDRGIEQAYRFIERDITRDTDGKYIGPGGVPLREYVDELFKSDLENLLAPKPVAGSGANGAHGTSGGGVQIEDIKAGSANLEAARQRIASLLSQHFGK